MEIQMVVAGCIINKNKILLIHHKKLDMWLPPGGHIEKNETPDDALKREIREELNIKIKILNRNNVPQEGNIKKQLAIPFHVNVHSVGDHDHCCFFYLCELHGEDIIKLEEGKIKSFCWLSPEELNKNSIPKDVKNIALKAFELYEKLKASSQ